MRILELELQHFRNYSGQRVSFDPDCNVIFGENAQGKTNLLEAIVYLSCGKSPRARTDREMIAFDAPAAVLEAGISARDREFRTRVELYRDRRRKMWVNQVPAKNSAALSQVYHTVFFCPDDLYLIREGAAARRRFMDTALCQLRPRYAAALAEYHRLYDHKTRILRDSEERPDLLELLPDFNERMVRFGAVLVHYRRQFAEALNRYAARHHRECSGGRERLEVTYQTVSSVTDPAAEVEVLTEQLRAHMESHQGAERASRMCLSGPHKDDLVITIGPLIMMKFVVKTCQKHGLRSIVSMNPIMIDGTGMCGGCRLTVGGETKFACVDGPDFDGDLVDFDEAMARGTMYRPFEAHAREAACNLLNQEVK